MSAVSCESWCCSTFSSCHGTLNPSAWLDSNAIAIWDHRNMVLKLKMIFQMESVHCPTFDRHCQKGLPPLYNATCICWGLTCTSYISGDEHAAVRSTSGVTISSSGNSGMSSKRTCAPSGVGSTLSSIIWGEGGNLNIAIGRPYSSVYTWAMLLIRPVGEV